MSARNFEKQFAAAVRDEGGCLLWQGGVWTNGYPRYNRTGAHRMAYETFVGPIPAGQTVDHLCFKPLCVEPTHLRLLSHLANCRSHATRPVVVPDDECINGHKYDEANTYYRPNGHRDCRACIRERVAAYKARRAAA